MTAKRKLSSIIVEAKANEKVNILLSDTEIARDVKKVEATKATILGRYHIDFPMSMQHIFIPEV